MASGRTAEGIELVLDTSFLLRLWDYIFFGEAFITLKVHVQGQRRYIFTVL